MRFVVNGVAGAIAYFLDGDWPLLTEAATRYGTSVDTARSPLGIVAATHAALGAGRAGNTDAARVMLRHFTAAVEHAAPTSYTIITSVPVAATVVWELGAAEYAAIYRHLLLDLLLAGAGDHIFGPLELWVARMSPLLGDTGETQEYFARARSKLEASGQTHVRAILNYDQACVLIRAGAADRARSLELLDAALDGFHAHGMLGWARRATEQKEALTSRAGLSAPADRQYPAGLTPREAEVLRLVAAGLTNKEIAAQLVLSVPTVERHVANIYAKIGASRRYEAIAFARCDGLGPDPAGRNPGSPADTAR